MADRCLLYYITDRSQLDGDEAERRHALLDRVAAGARAGINFIQLREKDLSGRELERLTLDALAVVRENSSSTRLLLNSRSDITMASGADGVHLRAEDLTPEEVRRVWISCNARGKRRGEPLIAASCHTRDEVGRAEFQAADFAVFAPVFGKNNASSQPVGLDALQEACRFKIPVLALGGVTMENAAACLKVGASGVAGIRLFQKNKIEDVVGALRGL